MKKVNKIKNKDELRVKILISEIEKKYKLYWNRRTNRYCTKNYIEYYGDDFLTDEEKYYVKLIDELNSIIKQNPHLKERREEVG